MTKPRHRLTDLDASNKTARCGACGPAAPVIWRAHRSEWVCKVANRKNPAARAAAARRYRLRRNFGITEDQYQQMLAAQDGVCAICQRECPTGRALAVDHDHQNGRVRGLLCAPCNRGLGLFRDDQTVLFAAIQYLS